MRVLSAGYEYVGQYGPGIFTQSGGTNAVGGTLWLGSGTGNSGSYSLSGNSLLSAVNEYVGGAAATGSFQQTGGANTVSELTISSGGSYQLAGGTLSVTGFVNQGVFSGGGASAAISASGMVDLTGGTWQNLGNISLSMGPNSLLIVPAGFNPSTSFAHYTNLGLSHTAGSTLIVPAGQGFAGGGSINDPVNCQGTIAAASGVSLNLNSGLVVSGTGSVTAWGNLTVNDSSSGISGGSLYFANLYVGNPGRGAFTQSNGIANSNYIYLGNSAGDSGTYNLGNGQLLAYYEYLGYSGTGTLAQSGGTNSGGSYNCLYLGYNAGSNGTYNLGNGQLSEYSEYVGYSGVGTFSQSGGANSTSVFNYLYLGYQPGSKGSYNLSGGQLSVSDFYVGYSGTGSFTQTGGTNSGGNTYFVLGYSAGGSGSYNLSNGLLSTETQYVGYSGTGSFTQSGGTNNETGYLYLGYNAGSVGAYNLNNGQLLGGYEYVGYAGTGSFTQTGGTHTVSNLYIGTGGGVGNGMYTLSGSGLLSAASEEVGNVSETASFLQTGGTNTTTLLSIGSGNSYLLAGGALRLNGSVSNQGTLRRRRHGGFDHRRRRLGPDQRHLADLGEYLAEHEAQLAADRAGGIQPVDGVRQLQHAGFDIHGRQHAHGACREGIRGLGLDCRSGHLPGMDRQRRYDQSQWRVDALRHGDGPVGIWEPGQQQSDVRDQRRNPLRLQPVCRQRRNRHLHTVRRVKRSSPCPRKRVRRRWRV